MVWYWKLFVFLTIFNPNTGKIILKLPIICTCKTHKQFVFTTKLTQLSCANIGVKLFSIKFEVKHFSRNHIFVQGSRFLFLAHTTRCKNKNMIFKLWFKFNFSVLKLHFLELKFANLIFEISKWFYRLKLHLWNKT